MRQAGMLLTILLLASPGRAEFQQVDLKIFGMD